MPYIEANQKTDVKSAAILHNVQQRLGFTPNMYTTLSHSPAALAFYAGAQAALASGRLSAALRDQIALTVAGANGCDYCASAHTMLGGKSGLAARELALNLQGISSDRTTQAVLTFVRQVLDLRGHVSETDLESLRDAGFGDAEIVEIMAVIGINIFSNYFNSVAGTDVDFPLVSTALAAIFPAKAA